MKNRPIFLALLISSLTLYGQKWEPKTAKIAFKIKHALGQTAEGSFKGLKASIVFDEKDLNQSAITATLYARTIDTGISLRDKTMKSESYFDVEHYPQISMVATKIEKGTEPYAYHGYFDLKIKKTTKNIKIPFTFRKDGANGQFTAQFSVNRLDFAIGEKSSLLADSATITIVLNTTKL